MELTHTFLERFGRPVKRGHHRSWRYKLSNKKKNNKQSKFSKKKAAKEEIIILKIIEIIITSLTINVLFVSNVYWNSNNITEEERREKTKTKEEI